MKLIIVDIQPEYESNTTFDIGDMLRKAAEDYSQVLVLFNGEDTLGMISEGELKNFYLEKLDYDEEVFDELLSKSTFFDKGYGFFRDVMDSSVCFDRSSIVKIVKYMINKDVRDIRELEEEDINAIGVDELLFDDLEDYGFWVPDLADELPRWSGSDLAGGARNECMAEVEILGAAQGLSFNHVDDFIYEGENRYNGIMSESTLLREYIREWVRANDKLLMLDKQGIYLEKEDREEISKFLKSMGLLESKTCGLQPPQTPLKPRTASVVPVDTYRFPNLPYPSVESPEGQKDLDMVIHQYNNRVVPEELQDAADNDMDGLFQSYLDSRGLTYNTSYYKSLRLDLIPLIKLLKKHYNRLRPNQTATLLGIEFPGDTLKSAQTPSYPSGHTIQAFVLAHKFGEQFPDHVDNLLSIAELIAQSRIDRGVHFPSDIEFGRLIAYLIVEEMKDGTTP